MSDESLRGDELVSAYLDGEASPVEIAEVERDDALMARVEELRSIRDAMSQPVVPMSAEQRDQMISAALAVADAEAAQRREAKIVPIRQRHQTLLAVAAAVMLLAAVVSAGLIVSRGGDESADVAAEATAATEAAPAAAAAPAEADMAMADDSADYEMAAESMAEEEAPMAEEEPMAEEALAAGLAAEEALSAAVADADAAGDPEFVAELEAQSAATEAEAAQAAAEAAEAEQAMEEPAEEAAEAQAARAEEEEERSRDEEAAVPVVDLGTFENLESLFDNIAARWSAALEDGATADSGTCYAAVHEQALGLEVETAQAFTARVGAEDRMTLDGRFARRADGSALIIHAEQPGCETGIHELPS